MSDQLITFSNYAVACMIVQQANQYTNRINTDTGFADLIYVVYNTPVEGFFKGKNDPTINNVVWDAFLVLYKASEGRASLTCKDFGFQMGRIWGTLINFTVPIELFYDQVAQ